MGALLVLPAPIALLVAYIGSAVPPSSGALGRGADVETPAAAFDAAYAHGIAKGLAALGPRTPGSPAHARARALILGELGGAAMPPAREAAHVGPDGESVYNIFADRPGASSMPPILVGAHYDTVAGSPGASDDAAGVGIVLGLARAFGRHPGARPMIFSVWDGEETGLKGSTADAHQRARGGRLPSAVLAIDLCGWRDGATVLHTFRDGLWGARPLAPSGLVGVMLGVATALDVPLAVGDPIISPVYQTLTRLVRIPFDADDAAYARLGIPALFVSDSSFTRFAPAYHTPRDTAEILSEEMIGRTGRLLAGTLAALDAGASPEGPTTWVALGRWCLQGRTLLIVAILSGLPLAGALIRRRGGAALLAGAYTAAAVLEPAATLLWLAPGVWLAPLAGARAPVSMRWASGALALVMPLACAAVFVAASLRFGWHPPRIGLPATIVHGAAALMLVRFVWLRR